MLTGLIKSFIHYKEFKIVKESLKFYLYLTKINPLLVDSAQSCENWLYPWKLGSIQLIRNTYLNTKVSFLCVYFVI